VTMTAEEATAERARASARELAQPIIIGELTDVPQPHSLVASQWPQEATLRIIHRFSTASARAAAFTAPNPAADRGMLSYLKTGLETEGPEFWNGAAWRRPWNMPWGRVAAGPFVDVPTVGTNILVVGATPVIPTVPGRQYRGVIDNVNSYGTVATDIFGLGVGETGQATVGTATVQTIVTQGVLPPFGANIFFTVATAANRAFDMRIGRTSGTGVLQIRMRLSVYDDGPVPGAVPA
jgi:hypothetical protein